MSVHPIACPTCRSIQRRSTKSLSAWALSFARVDALDVDRMTKIGLARLLF